MNNHRNIQDITEKDLSLGSEVKQSKIIIDAEGEREIDQGFFTYLPSFSTSFVEIN